MRAVIESSDLAPDEAERLWALVRDARPPVAADATPRRAQTPDSFTYRLTVATSGSRDVYAFTEATMGAELGSLVRRLERHLTI